jgi:signal transduction histidine kinase
MPSGTPPAGGRVEVSAGSEDGALVLAITDTGPGVAAELRERLFEPFVTGRADGSGLGLAIARELADAHGGRLILREADDRTPTRGAVFVLELPQEHACPSS